MITKWMRLILVGLLSLSAISTAFAQDSIGIGDSVDGEASDERTEYEIDLEEGQVIEVSIEADWDTYLELYNEDEDRVAFNDDGGDGLQSLMVYAAEETGTYVIRVVSCCSSDNTPEGDYELSVEEIEVVDMVDGGLLEYDNDEDVDADDALAVEARFEGEEGDVINIITVSDNYLNTTMTLLNAQGEEIAESTNYYGDAVIQRLELEESGTFTIRIVESQGGILDGDIEVEVQLTEILTLDDGELELEIGRGENVMYVNFTAEEDVVYTLSVALDDEPRSSDISLYILEPGQNASDYSEINLRMNGGRGTSILFEAEDDGVFVIRMEYYGNDDLEVVLNLEQVGE